MALVEVWLSENRPTDKLLLTPLAIAGPAALAWRRRAAVPVLAAIIVVSALSFLVVPASGDDPLAGAIALVVALYSVGAHAEGRWAVAGALAALVVVVALTASDP